MESAAGGCGAKAGHGGQWGAGGGRGWVCVSAFSCWFENSWGCSWPRGEGGTVPAAMLRPCRLAHRGSEGERPAMGQLHGHGGAGLGLRPTAVGQRWGRARSEINTGGRGSSGPPPGFGGLGWGWRGLAGGAVPVSTGKRRGRCGARRDPSMRCVGSAQAPSPSPVPQSMGQARSQPLPYGSTDLWGWAGPGPWPLIAAGPGPALPHLRGASPSPSCPSAPPRGD